LRGEFLPEESDAGESTDTRKKGWLKISRENLAWFAVVFLIGIAVGAVITTFGRSEDPPAIIISTREPKAEPTATGTPTPLKVYISGEVISPAVYELPQGSIVQDLVEAAGGFTFSADNEVVNLAFTLNDGMHIHVPSREQETELPVISEGSGSGGDEREFPVNINQASAQDLELLPGIGPVLAGAIIEYRDSNGDFKELDQIMEVPGIGPATFEEIKELISLK